MKSYRQQFEFWIRRNLVGCLEEKTNNCQTVSLFDGVGERAVGFVEVNHVHLQ
jgi:hypothetical protein